MDQPPFYMQDPQQQPPPFYGQPEIFPPWENDGRPLVERWVETVKAVFASTPGFFARMAPSGGISKPLVFGLIGGSAGSIAGQLFGMILTFILRSLGLAAAQGAEQKGLALMMAGNLGGGLCGILLAPIAIAISMFINAGVAHICLMLVGGANRDYEATFRVQAYLLGSLGLLQFIPFCGSLAYGIWFLVASIVGLSKVHNISTGRAALAVLLPVILCCVCVVLLFGFGGFGMTHGHIPEFSGFPR